MSKEPYEDRGTRSRIIAGSLAVGALSDLLEPRWGAYHYARAGRTLGADLARAATSQGWADVSGPGPTFIPLSRESRLDGLPSAERRVDCPHRGPFQP